MAQSLSLIGSREFAGEVVSFGFDVASGNLSIGTRVGLFGEPTGLVGLAGCVSIMMGTRKDTPNSVPRRAMWG